MGVTQTATLAFCIVFSIAILSCQPSDAAELYIGPPDLAGGRAMFAQPAEWAETRGHVTGLVTSDHGLDAISDAELRGWCEKLNSWGLSIQLEVGAVKEWSTRGAQTFAIEAPKWDRVIGLGCPVSSIAMDEPLGLTLGQIHRPIAYAVDQTVAFMAEVRQKYPLLSVGDIEPYPSVPVSVHLDWLRTLADKLAGVGVRGLEFYRVDPDWVSFDIAQRGNWNEIKNIEDAVRAGGIRFGLIYWDSDYPSLKSRGLAGDQTWYVGIMHQGYAYSNVGGRPDQFVIQSWVSAPSTTIPDSARFSFTNSVRDFAARFVH